MGLGTYRKASAFIPWGPEEDSDGLTLHALTLVDVTDLVADHLGQIASALEIYEETKAKIEEAGSVDRMAILIIHALPELTAELIAVSAGEPELAHVAQNLAFGIQIRALSEIARLTVEDVGGIKNLFAALASVLPGLQLPRTVQAARNMLTPKSDA